MKKSAILKTYQIVSGALLGFIGSATLLAPIKMKGGAGIDIVGNISVINDVRAASALLLAIGVITLLGPFSRRLAFTSTITSSITFLSLALGRIISILVDGTPVNGLMKATGLELVLGAIGLTLFIVYREKNN